MGDLDLVRFHLVSLICEVKGGGEWITMYTALKKFIGGKNTSGRIMSGLLLKNAFCILISTHWMAEVLKQDKM